MFLIFFCGNDFIPQIPFLNMETSFMIFIVQIYCDFLNISNKFIIVDGLPSFQSMKQIIKMISLSEKSLFEAKKSVYYNTLFKFMGNLMSNKPSDEVKKKCNDFIRCNPDENKFTFEEYKKWYYLRWESILKVHLALKG